MIKIHQKNVRTIPKAPQKLIVHLLSKPITAETDITENIVASRVNMPMK